VRTYIFEEFLPKKTAKKVLVVCLRYIFIYECNLFWYYSSHTVVSLTPHRKNWLLSICVR